MISDAIESLGASDYTITRTAAVTYDANGRATGGGAVTSVAIRAMVQPLSGRELAALPEGLRAKETRWVWSATELKTAKGGGESASANEPDKITIDGDLFEIQKVENWTAGGFWKAFAVREG